MVNVFLYVIDVVMKGRILPFLFVLFRRSKILSGGGVSRAIVQQVAYVFYLFFVDPLHQ